MTLELFENIILHEGWRSQAYTDTSGCPTIGVGFLIKALDDYEYNLWSADCKMPMDELKALVTREASEQEGRVNVWRYGTAVMSPRVGVSILAIKLLRFQHQLFSVKGLEWLRSRSEVLRDAFVDAAYNMGIGQWGKSGLLSFSNTIEAIRTNNLAVAELGILNSKWAKQVPKRAADFIAAVRYDIANFGKDVKEANLTKTDVIVKGCNHIADVVYTGTGAIVNWYEKTYDKSGTLTKGKLVSTIVNGGYICPICKTKPIN